MPGLKLIHASKRGPRVACHVGVRCSCLMWVQRLSKFPPLSAMMAWHGNAFRVNGPLCGESTHYDDVIMTAMASQITSLTIAYSIVHSGADQRKHQSSTVLAFVWGIHRRPVNSPHKWPVTWKRFPFDDVIMTGDQWFPSQYARNAGIWGFFSHNKHLNKHQTGQWFEMP